MYRYRNLLILLTIVCVSVPVFAHHIAVVAPKDNGTDAITTAQLVKILKSEMRSWPDGSNVVVVISKNSPTTLQVLERVCNLSEMEVKALIAAHPSSFIQAESDAALLTIVESKPGALGIVDVHAVTGNHVRVLKVDGKLPMEKGYLPH
ncbi:MAG TPA: substrate-binding domain-containing protein [Candidatus Angelobacter sp.]|nr:substrate-binding domain-containing protein [Candidatus Angelobacter sp.]